MDAEKICRKLARQLNLELDVVEKIVSHQFKAIVDSMKDENDTRDILINKLYKFKLKKRFKTDKSQNYKAK